MELYFAGSSVPEADNWIIENKKSRLYSFLNDKSSFKRYNEKEFRGHMFIDSGAFSAWTRGDVINVKDYITWLNNNSNHLHLFGQVDSIPGDRVFGATPSQVKEASRKTWENYLFMRKRLNKPDGLLYTFHVGEPIEFLQNALEWKNDNGDYIPYIALGGMVGKPRHIRDTFLEKCFITIRQSSNPNVKVHAFGMTDFELLEKYPIYSADSTSWIMVGAMGNVMTDYGNIAVSNNYKNNANHYSHLSQENIDNFNQLIHQFGFTLDDLAEVTNNRILFNAMYMDKKTQELNSKERKFNYRKKLF
jgi:hypothetical protein